LGESNGTLNSDLWEYDPLEDIWTEVDNFEGGARTQATVFVINNRAYIFAGYDGTDFLNDLWKFNPGFINK
jgi:N-acetylneuraminic acid mutarotase